MRLLSSTGVLLSVVSVAACGGSRVMAPTTPSTPAASTPAPATASDTWSIAGQVVVTVSGQPVGSATLTPGWSLAPVTADGQGNFTLGAVANPPTTPYSVTLSAPGMISHGVWLPWARGSRTGVTLDMIQNSPPFSMDFYRQFARGTYDQPGAPWGLQRWSAAPSFYVRTVDQNGRAVEPEVLAKIVAAIQQAVPAFTAGRYTAAAIVTGADQRPPQTDWINVEVHRDPNEHQLCGYAYIGANPGTITLNDDVCSCGSNKIPGAVTMHEVGHALGFFHVSDKSSLMYPFVAGNCPNGALSAAESYHAAIVYSRPYGNTDPDDDPDDNPDAFAALGLVRPRILVIN